MHKRILFYVLLFLSTFSFLSAHYFTQYIAHYAHQYGWKTKITIQNFNSVDVNVTLQLFENNGGFGPYASFTVPANGFKSDYVENFFTDSIPETGSIYIFSEEPGEISKISSIILFEHEGSDGSSEGMGGLQSTKESARVLTFPWFENSTNFTTGIAILNVSDNYIVVTLKAFSSDGSVYYSKPIKLSRRERIIGFPSDFFDVTIPDMATLEAVGTGNIVGFIIMYNPAITKVEAINGEIMRNNLPTNVEYRNLSYGYDYYGGTGGFTDGILVSPDGNKIYTLVEHKGIYVFDKNDVADSKLITIPDFIHGVFALSPIENGNGIVIDQYGGFHKVDFSTDNVSEISGVSVFSNPNSIAFSNDGRFLAVSSGYRVYLFNAANLNDFYDYDDISDPNSNIICVKFLEYCDVDGYQYTYLLALDAGLNKLYIYACRILGDINGRVSLDYPPQEKTLNINSPNDIEVFDGTIYICGYSNKLCKLTSVDGTPSYINISTYLQDITISPDGRYILGTYRNENKIFIYDLLLSEERIIGVSKNIDKIIISPTELVAYFSGECMGKLY